MDEYWAALRVGSTAVVLAAWLVVEKVVQWAADSVVTKVAMKVDMKATD